MKGGQDTEQKENRQQIGDVAEILLNYFEKNTTYQTDKMMTIPAESYADLNQWRAEIDLIFKRVPLMLALSCEMPKPSDYKAMEVAGLPVLIVRDKAGTARAFVNACAHRWAPVAPEGYGRCTGFRFVCPFHGWTYGADGKLTGIADRAKFGDIERSSHGLRQLPCEERYGMIFACLTPETPMDLGAQYGALLEEFSDLGMEKWTFVGSNVLEGPNWKLILTNFFESYHFGVQHAKTVAADFVSNLNHYEGFGPNMRIGFAKHGIAKLRDVPRSKWGRLEGPAFTFMRYLFPNVIGSMYLTDFCSAFAQILPGPTPDKTRVVQLYLRQDSPKNDGERERFEAELQEMKRGSDQVLAGEDFTTGIATQRSLASGAHKGLLYGRNERGPQYFHEWVNWYLRADPNLPKPVM